MIEKILKWGGIVFAVVGIICLFLEAFATLKRKTNPKLTIAGMIFLSISVIGYVITELILRDKDVPIIFSIIWIAFLWLYLICNLISSVLIARKHRAEKRAKKQAMAVAATTELSDGNNTETANDSADVTATAADDDKK